jgi:hypothetical protein
VETLYGHFNFIVAARNRRANAIDQGIAEKDLLEQTSPFFLLHKLLDMLAQFNRVIWIILTSQDAKRTT